MDAGCTRQAAFVKTVRRAMLRRIVGTARAPDEEYVSWMKRITGKAEAIAKSAGVRDWTRAHSKAKWSWAGHVSRRSMCSWVWRLTAWRDSDWQSLSMECGSTRLLRPSRRRWMKWEDTLRRFCVDAALGKWTDLSQDRLKWADEATAFSNWFGSA